MYKNLHEKYPLFLYDFNETWVFRTDPRKKNTQILNFTKICAMGGRAVPCGATDEAIELLLAILRRRLKIWLLGILIYGSLINSTLKYVQQAVSSYSVHPDPNSVHTLTAFSPTSTLILSLHARRGQQRASLSFPKECCICIFVLPKCYVWEADDRSACQITTRFIQNSKVHWTLLIQMNSVFSNIPRLFQFRISIFLLSTTSLVSTRFPIKICTNFLFHPCVLQASLISSCFIAWL